MPERCQMTISRRAFHVGIVILLAAVTVSADGPTPANSKTPKYANHRDLMVYLTADGKQHAVKTPADWSIRRKHILKGMQQAMGTLPRRDKLPALDIQIKERLAGEGYERLTINFVAEHLKDGKKVDRVSAYLYIPNGIQVDERRAAMLALHPTHRIGKGVVDGQSERPNRAYAKELAQRGYVVIAPDYPSFGDLADYNFKTDSYVSGTMKGIVNHMRCVDLLTARDDVDPKRIGVIGHSLGGHNAMFVGVFDTRLKVIVSSCGWTPFHDYYKGKIQGWTSDRYMPRLRDVYKLDPNKVPFDFYEVAGALAPRAFFSNAPLSDGNFDAGGVKKAIAESKKVFDLHKKPERLQVQYPDAGHDFPVNIRRQSFQFIDQHLNHDPARNVP